MNTTIKKAAVVIVLAMLAACGGKNSSTDGGSHDIHDKKAWHQGTELGKKMLNECHDDTVAVQTWLLDFHVKCSEMKPKKAHDVRIGFQDYVTEHDPALAAKIF